MTGAEHGVSTGALAFLLTLALILFPGSGRATDAPHSQVSITKGAEVFTNRCSLCHGSDGRGEGTLPLSIENYPPTNLLAVMRRQDLAAIRDAVSYGGSRGAMHTEMPPFINELSHSELESVVLFVDLLRKDFQHARKLLDMADSRLPSARMGYALYRTRCSLCHGRSGRGDGRLSAIIKTPPPFDLTTSRMSETQVRDIVSKGGRAVGRSKQMPPWEGSLSRVEIDSLVLYLLQMRGKSLYKNEWH